MKYFLLVQLFIWIAVFSSVSARPRVAGQPSFVAQDIASETLLSKCDSALAKYAGRSDSARKAEPNALEIKSVTSVTVADSRYWVVLVGCFGWAEIVFVDSADVRRRPMRAELNVPSRYVAFGDYRDINDDGVPELFIHEASGSHGMYIVFVSVFEDSLSFVRDDKGHYQFFASGGGIQVKDLDGDKIDEIILKEMVWGDDPSADVDNPPKTIYRLQGNKYSADKKPE